MARASVGHVISIKVVNGDNKPVWCFFGAVLRSYIEPLNYKINKWSIWMDFSLLLAIFHFFKATHKWFLQFYSNQKIAFIFKMIGIIYCHVSSSVRRCRYLFNPVMESFFINTRSCTALYEKLNWVRNDTNRHAPLLHNIWQQQAALRPALTLTDEFTILTEADI